jgi:hypothetical protein
MSEGSGLSRLTLKFLEVFAAGLATAVSGYLIAHFTGYFAAVSPIAAVKQPSVMQPWVIQQSVRSGPAAPVVHEAAPVAAMPQSNMADQSPSANGTGAKPRDAAEIKSRDAAEIKSRDAVEIKPRDAVEPKSRDATETRPHEAARGAAAPSFEARVRAALAKAGPANSGPAHPASDDAPRREAVVPVDAMPRVSNGAPQPVDTPTGAIAATPPPGDSAPRSVPVAQPPAAAAPAMGRPAMENIAAPTPTIQLAPPSAVEIKSQPVASVDPDQPAPVAAQPPPSTDHDGPFAAITRRLHVDKLLTGGDQPPRPPMPVGQ